MTLCGSNFLRLKISLKLPRFCCHWRQAIGDESFGMSKICCELRFVTSDPKVIEQNASLASWELKVIEFLTDAHALDIFDSNYWIRMWTLEP